MKLTYQKAKEVVYNLAENLGVATDTTGHISDEGWIMDDYYFVITAGGKTTVEFREDMLGEGFPQ